jgi:hypothetical protein
MANSNTFKTRTNITLNAVERLFLKGENKTVKGDNNRPATMENIKQAIEAEKKESDD